MKNRNRMLSWLILFVLAGGCAQWSAPPSTEFSSLPLPNLAPDSVVLEVTFVRIPPEHADFAERFWREVDETAFTASLRKRLAGNGFRCGLFGASPPRALQEVLDQQSPSDLGEGVTKVDPSAEVVARSQRLRSRAGHAGKIVVRSNPVEKLAALVYDEDGRVRGESFDQAQFYFSVTSYPRGDGQVQVELAPIIEHGQPRSRVRGQHGAWTVDNTSRPARVYEDLKIDALLSAGASVAIGCTGVHRGLGQQFLGEDREERVPRLLLVVRLQQVQMDDRFAEQQQLEPVISLSE